MRERIMYSSRLWLREVRQGYKGEFINDQQWVKRIEGRNT